MWDADAAVSILVLLRAVQLTNRAGKGWVVDTGRPCGLDGSYTSLAARLIRAGSLCGQDTLAGLRRHFTAKGA